MSTINKLPFSNQFERGHSFNWAGDWKEGRYYYNDEYVTDFVVYNSNVVLSCRENHSATEETEPELIYDESGKIIGVDSIYWSFVLHSEAPSKEDIIGILGDDLPFIKGSAPYSAKMNGSGDSSEATVSFTIAGNKQSHATAFNATAFGSSTASASGAISANSATASAQNSAAFNNAVASTKKYTFAINEGTASGEDSFASGKGSTASGARATAFGLNTVASGVEAFTRGQRTVAAGAQSIAEGLDTEAYGAKSQASGEKTFTVGASSFAFGKGYKTNVEFLISGAANTTTFDTDVEHNLQINDLIKYENKIARVIDIPDEYSFTLDKKLSNEDIEEGNIQIVTGVAYGPTSVMLGDKCKAIGEWSSAEGNYTIASGDSSHAEGYDVIAHGNYSHAEGNRTTASGERSHAEGYYTTSSGGAAHAEGSTTIASGGVAHAEGSSTTASGGAAHAEGLHTTASGENGSHAEGSYTIASGEYGSHAEGYGSSSTASGAHAEGGYYYYDEDEEEDIEVLGGTADGYGSHAEGGVTIARGVFSHAEGHQTTAYGDHSHIEGGSYFTAESREITSESTNEEIITKWGNDTNKFSLAKGEDSHVEGNGSLALGTRSHAEGYKNRAINQNSHVEGFFTSTEGDHAHAEGKQTIAKGAGSHAEGVGGSQRDTMNMAEGIASHVEGYYNKAQNQGEHAEGQYNNSHKKTSGTEDQKKAGSTAHSVGIGTGTSARANAFEIMQNGDAYLIGVGDYEGDNLSTDPNRPSVTLQDTINGIEGPYEENEWSILKTKRDNGTLKPGKWYRIIDYVTTTRQTDTQSAGHQFDIIVRADDVDKLNENAYAIQHDGDTYFANNNLSAWKLMYCLNNDVNKFSWAHNGIGKGVIYRMIDEFGNDLPYDFKNIQFKRKLNSNNEYDPNDGTDVYVYTFGVNVDYSCNKNNIINPCVHNNIILNFYTPSYGITLNNNVFLNKNAISNCSNNIFGENCYNNTFGDGCYNNTFNYGFHDNQIGYNSYYNTFKEFCGYNALANDCAHNNFGVSCQYNDLESNCKSNTFKNDCQHNVLLSYCCSNKFGNECSYNEFGSYCEYNAFEDYCNHISFVAGSVLASYCRYNTVESGNQYVSIDANSTSDTNICKNNIISRNSCKFGSTTRTLSLPNPSVNNDYVRTIIKPDDDSTRYWIYWGSTGPHITAASIQ